MRQNEGTLERNFLTPKMAKSDTPYSDILKNKAYRPPNEPDWAEGKQINGFDTETADGQIFMLSFAWENQEGEVIQNDGKFIPSSKLWNVITHKQARNSLNMWYNLDFDANVLLSHILDKEQLAELSVNAYVETDGYEITFIPGKFLKVKDENRNVCTHYDASQFFYTSLENACQEWLNVGKAEGVDTTRFGKSENQVNNYILENWFEIRKYARKDAELVRNLWQEACSVGEDLDIPMGKPFSTGYLAESYLNHVLPEKPGIGPSEMASLAWDSYKGGRFEVFKRGNVGKVSGPDINSAYPWVLSNLPDPKTLRWERIESNSDIDKLREANYGFVKANVITDSSRTIQPFAKKPEDWDKLIYPALEGQEVNVLIDTFLFALENGYIEEYSIEEAWLGHETVGTKYPFDFIEPMYKERKDFEADGLIKRGMLLKIILNSMYGKTCQTTPKRQKVEEETVLEDYQAYVSSLALPEMLKEKYENGFIEWLEAGSWFNPFIASYITGITRLELHKRVVEYGLEENTVMMATDCLMIEKEAYEESNFEQDLVKSGLGNWDYDYAGDAFVIGAGVYEVDLDEKEGTKTQTRGFREANLEGNLREACEIADEAVEIESLRPKTVAEAIWHNESVSNVGQFMESTRKLSPDMDDKRQWQGEASFSKFLQEKQESKALEL